MPRDSARWNDIDVSPWEIENIRVSANEYCNEPIFLEVENYTDSVTRTLSPNEARELAKKLIELSDAADKAGKRNAA